MINSELYIPKFVRIASVRNESALVKSYRLEARAEFAPGQFFQVSVPGCGEAPVSISSSPADREFIEITIRKTGKVTAAIHNLERGDLLGLRGPYGNSFPAEYVANRDLLFVAGGIGLAPLRSLIRYALKNRGRFGSLCLLYGARSPAEMIYKNELSRWQGMADFEVFLTVDEPEEGWQGNTGVVTSLLDRIDPASRNFVAIVCGPPVMIKYTIQKLLRLGFAESDIIVSLERHMKCGVGKCGHCYLVNKYVCVDGPVFAYSQLKDLKPMEPLLV